jgi:hypothetical protein
MYTAEMKKLIDEVQNQIMQELPENAKYQIVLKDECMLSNIYCDSYVLYTWTDADKATTDEIILGLFETNTPTPENWITAIDFEDVEQINIVDKYEDKILKVVFRAREKETQEVKI